DVSARGAWRRTRSRSRWRASPSAPRSASARRGRCGWDGRAARATLPLLGAGETRVPFFANVVGHYAVGLPIAVVLGIWHGQGVIGLWWGLCAGLTAV